MKYTCPDHGTVEVTEALTCPTCNNTVCIEDSPFLLAVANDLQTKQALKEGETIKGLRPTVIKMDGGAVYVTFEVVKD